MSQYYSIITNIGLLKEAAANSPAGSPVKLTHLAIGDASGTSYDPSNTQTALVHEVYRTPLTHVAVDNNNPNQLIIEGVINEEIGPFYIREVGIFDTDGQLFAIGKYPETFKPALTSGSGKRLYIRMILGFMSTPQVNLIISENINNDPNFSNTVNNALSTINNAITTVNTTLGGKLAKAANLADLKNIQEARANLGLGIAALAGNASETLAGVTCLATQAEVDAKLNETKVITPKTLANSTQLTQTSNRTSAISVAKLATSRTARENMAVIMKDGNIKIWGRGANYGNTDPGAEDQYQPVILAVDPDAPPASKFVQVTLSAYCGYALDGEGKVYSWGYNGYGHLGHGDTISRRYAKRIEYFVTNNIQIAEIITSNEIAYNDVVTVLFRDTNGYVYGCGYNYEGVLGSSPNTDRYTPIRIGNLENVVQVVLTCGNGGTAYFRTDNGNGVRELYVTGYNVHGQLGTGNTNNALTPTKITGYSNVTHVAACGGVNVPGNYTYGSAIFIDSGKVYTTGYNGSGQLGQGHTTDLRTWTRAGVFSDIVYAGMVGSPYTTTYIINSTGNILLCGYNGYGQLGIGSGVDSPTFITPSGGDLGFQGKIKKVLLAGDRSYHGILILDNDGQVYSCGYGHYGALSHGDMGSDYHLNFKKALNSKIAYEPRKCIDITSSGYASGSSVFLLYDDGTLRTAGYSGYGLQGRSPGYASSKVYTDVLF